MTMTFDIPDNDVAFAPNPQSQIFNSTLRALSAGIYNTGVVTGCTPSQHAAGAAMSVDIGSGTVITGGLYKIYAGGTATIGAADMVLPRIDLIVVSSAGSLVVRIGITASAPKEPALSAGDALLAQVYIAPGATALHDVASAGESLAQILDRRVFVSDYHLLNIRVIDGISYAKTGAGVRAALTDASAAGGGIVLVPAKTTIVCDATSIAVQSNCQLIGMDLYTSVLQCITGAVAVSPVIGCAGAGSTGYALTADSGRGSITAQISSGNMTTLVAAGVGVGSLLLISESSVLGRHQVVRVASLTSTTFTFDSTLDDAYTIANSAAIQMTTGWVNNITVGNFSVVGNGNSHASTEPVLFTVVRDSTFLPIRILNFPAANYGYQADYGFNNEYGPCYVYNTGAAETATLGFSNLTTCRVKEPIGEVSGGFGPVFQNCIDVDVYAPQSIAMQERGMKFQACSSSRIHGGRIDRGDAKNNADHNLTIAYNCHDLTFIGLESYGAGTGSYGIHTDPTNGGNTRITFIGCKFYNNALGDIGTSTGDSAFSFIGCTYDPTKVVDNTTDGIFFSDTYRRHIGFVVAADQILTPSNTTPQNITGLAQYIGPSEIWEFKIVIYHNSPAGTANFKEQFTQPSGCAGKRYVSGTNWTPAAITSLYQGDLTSALSHTGLSTAAVIVIEGVIVNGATGGVVQFQGSQNTSVAENTLVLKGSNMTMKRLA